MAKTVDLRSLKKDAAGDVRFAIERYEKVLKLEKSKKLGYWHVWWVASMTSVELHAIWERYVEARLVAALNHAPRHFLEEQGFVGMSGISKKFARYIVREGRPFFIFGRLANSSARQTVALETPLIRSVPCQHWSVHIWTVCL